MNKLDDLREGILRQALEQLEQQLPPEALSHLTQVYLDLQMSDARSTPLPGDDIWDYDGESTSSDKGKKGKKLKTVESMNDE